MSHMNTCSLFVRRQNMNQNPYKYGLPLGSTTHTRRTFFFARQSSRCKHSNSWRMSKSYAPDGKFKFNVLKKITEMRVERNKTSTTPSFSCNNSPMPNECIEAHSIGATIAQFHEKFYFYLCSFHRRLIWWAGVRRVNFFTPIFDCGTHDDDEARKVQHMHR